MIESSFDLRQPLFDERGRPDHRQIECTVELFFDSWEVGELTEKWPDIELGRVRDLLDCATRFGCGEVAQINPEFLDFLLLEHFPGEVIDFEVSGRHTVAEFRAFFEFFERKSGLGFADCVQYLQRPGLAGEFEAAMNDIDNYGVAKCVVYLGRQAGFDMSDETQMARFIAIFHDAISDTKPLPRDPASHFQTSPLLERIFLRYDGDPDTHNLFECLMNAGAELYEELHEELFGTDANRLIAFVDDRDLADESAPGQGWIPVHAARVLGERSESAAAPSLIAIVEDFGGDKILHSVALSALKNIGGSAVLPITEALRKGVDEETGRALRGLLGSIDEGRYVQP